MERDGGLIWFQSSMPQHLGWEMSAGVEDTRGTAAGGGHFGSKSAAAPARLLGGQVPEPHSSTCLQLFAAA